MSPTAADGSPVEAFASMGPGDQPERVAAVCPPPATILELGCGAGRVTRALAERGYAVTAVDQSAAMLAHVRGAARLVRADIEGLDLDDRFEVVLLASYLVHAPGRHELLATCARHVAPDGSVLVQRHDPGWLAEVHQAESTGPDGWTFAVGDIDHRPGATTMTVTYTSPDRRSWSQRYTAAILHDAEMEAALAAAGLRLERWLATGEFREWAVARPRRRGAHPRRCDG